MFREERTIRKGGIGSYDDPRVALLDEIRWSRKLRGQDIERKNKNTYFFSFRFFSGKAN